MEQHTSSLTDLVTGIVLLLLVAAITTMISKKVPKLPLTVALVFAGIAISAFGHDVPGLSLISDFQLTPELVLFVFIPTLVFESSISLNARQVSRNIWPILTLAIPGLLISTGIIGLIFYLLSNHVLSIEMDWMVALLLGAILSATDPVAVVSIFRQLGVPERLTVLVEGESLFNDATSLVLATILIGLLVSGDFSSQVLFDGHAEFFVVFSGGILVGLVLALMTGFALGQVESDPTIEITLTTILAYCSFVIAEHVFHVSGIMAVVAAGLTLGSWGRSKISPSTSDFLKQFWGYLAYVANALIFLMVGLQIDLMVLWQSIDLIGVVVVAMLVSRAIVIFGIVPLVGKIPSAEKIAMPFQLVMYWGGLRGAIALAIVLSLPEFEYKAMLVAVVMGAVLFTLVVQGLSIELLVKFLGLNTLSLPDKLAKLEGDRDARQEALSRLTSLVDGGLFSIRVADNIRERCERQLEVLEKELDALNRSMTSDQMANILALRCLAREKSRVYELFSRGLINEWSFRELDHTVTVQLEEVRHLGVMPTAGIEPSVVQKISGLVFRLFEKMGLLGLIEGFSTARVVRDYEVAWGRYRAASSVLSAFSQIANKGQIDEQTSRQLKAVYEEILNDSKTQLDQVAEFYPEFVESIQEQLGQRLLLIAEHESVAYAADRGMISDGIAATILKEQAVRIRELKQGDISASFELDVHEILSKVPMFSKVEASGRDIIGSHLKRRTVPRGSIIVKEGEEGGSIFLIARGIAKVEKLKDGKPQAVATLYAGDFFGETALLHDAPRNATTFAATPCTLYELRRKDLEAVFKIDPEIRTTVEQIDRERLTTNTATGYR